MTAPTTYRKKLIEVALPLEEINHASAREKSIRHGHPSTLHLWWARRPLAACRAVLFASLVDDPSALLELFPTEAEQHAERERLFAIIKQLVLWENSNEETALHPARVAIAQSVARAHGVALSSDLTPAQVATALRQYAPPVLDPFAGGGSIPLEAQRLGLEAHASDLNPVAVLINKALIEIPPRYAGRAPVNPAAREGMPGGDWAGARGLAADVRYYGQWMRDAARARIGQLYPTVALPKELGGGQATVIAWLWARTVTCPNPACGARMPLISSFELSKKPGRHTWVEPRVDRATTPPTITFTIVSGAGQPPAPPKQGRGAKFKCLACETVAPEQHIKAEGMAHRMGAQLMAIVAESKHSRVYLPPTQDQSDVAQEAHSDWAPNQELGGDRRAIWCPLYGLTTFGDLFTPRQLVALTTFSDLVGEARARVLADGGDAAYADAVATYLAIAVDRLADYNSDICSWHSGRETIRNTFARQAIPMVWDFVEANPLSASTGNFMGAIDWIHHVLEAAPGITFAEVHQQDATAAIYGSNRPLVSTDPPYYDNIGYADLSDFFYVWLRRSLGNIYPDHFARLLTPKKQELVATPYRFAGSKDKADKHFETGLGQVFANIAQMASDQYPLTVYYAFKQAEEDEGDDNQGNQRVASTGWETMLAGLIQAGFLIDGTWPMRTELSNRPVASGTNALASSIVLVCRPRAADAPLATRRDFLAALRRELPPALRRLQQGNIAPVDLAQAAIGPGMAVYSRYRRVVEQDGEPLSVRTALGIINQELDTVLDEQEGEYDPETRFAIAWFSQYGMSQAKYGDAETILRAKNTTLHALTEAGIFAAQGGKAWLIARADLPKAWDPKTTPRLTAWAVTQHLARIISAGEGEASAAAILRAVGGIGDTARALAYRLYVIGERQGWAQEALAYNALVIAWPELQRLSTDRVTLGATATPNTRATSRLAQQSQMDL